MNTPALLLLIISLSLGLSTYTFCHDTYPAMREEHRARQRCRLEWDGYQPAWWMCWPYWIGVEKLVFGHRIKARTSDDL